MLLVVIDTNVLVSALLSPGSNSAKILRLAMEGRIVPCFDSEILLEYESVLFRPKFPFRAADVASLLEQLRKTGFSVAPMPSDITFQDESDRKFYEVAKFCNATLITGNLKDFPRAPWILSPTDFCAKHLHNPC